MAIRPIEKLKASDWRSHRPTDLKPGDQYWEWWYFEIDFKLRGDTWKVITVLHFPHAFDPRRVLSAENYGQFKNETEDPCQYPGVTSYLVCDNRNEALVITRQRPVEGIKTPKSGPTLVELGKVATFKKLANGRYSLRVKHEGLEFAPYPWTDDLRLDLWVEFTPKTPGFRPKEATIIDGKNPVYWVCPMPNPGVRIRTLEIVEDGEYHVGPADFSKIKPLGGYHDHQWGHGFLFRDVGDWSWGRLSLPRGKGKISDKLVFFGGRTTKQFPKGSYQDTALVLASAVDGTLESLERIPGKPSFRALKRRRYPGKPAVTCGLRYFRELEINAKASDGTRHHWKLTHRLVNNVDAWPFYLRFLPTAVNQSTKKEVPVVSEYARWDRVHKKSKKRGKIRNRIEISDRLNKQMA